MPLKAANRSGVSRPVSCSRSFVARRRSSISAFGWTFSWMYNGGGVNDEIAPVLLILAAPDELRIQVSVPRISDLPRVLLLPFQDRLKLCRWNVPPLCLVMREGFDGLSGCGLFSHVYFFPVAG